MNDAERERIDEICRTACAKLTEAGCDTVQIIVTVHSPQTTARLSFGVGNFYARVGAAREFLISDEEQSRQHTRCEDDEG